MANRNGFGFIVICLGGLVFIITWLIAFPPVGYVDEEITVEALHLPTNIYQKVDPMRPVPEAMMGEKLQHYVPNWDDNPVAYVPEATVVDISMRSNAVSTVEKLRQYPHNWDDYPVSIIPESTMVK